MEIVILLILGVIQGLTEFLPVSSSGHMALAEQALGLQPRLFLETALHMGTLAVVVVWFRKEIAEILADAFRSFRDRGVERPLARAVHEDGGLRMLLLVAAASVPTAIVGLFIEKVWTNISKSTILVSCMLLVTASLLLITRYMTRTTCRLTFGAAMLIGLAQGVAATPGISRSGATIAVALLLGMEKNEAFRFSFLIAIPAILGASVLQARHLFAVDLSMMPGILLGVVAAALVGYVALSFLLKSVAQGHLYRYTWYLVPVGVAGLLIGLLRT